MLHTRLSGPVQHLRALSYDHAVASLWELSTPQTSAQPLVLLLPVPGHEPDYAIGRKDGDIILADDKSVSRSHGRITVAPLPGPSELIVTDLKSKFGTFIDGIRLAEGAEPRTVRSAAA